MKLSELLLNVPNTETHHFEDVDIKQLTVDSRQIRPGALFIAKKGAKFDGRDYAEAAIRSGAVALLVEDAPLKELRCPQIVTSDMTTVLSHLAKIFHHDPSSGLFMVGVTGTNGKTTTSYLIEHLIDESGLIGTVETRLGDQIIPSNLTTPDILQLNQILTDFKERGAKSVVMEVSSHGLIQGRTMGIDFDVAIFTNLTQDHLDYHHTMENYAAAKALLFENLKPHQTAIINLDDPASRRMLLDSCAKVLTYGIEREADLRASAVKLTSTETHFTLNYLGKDSPVSLPLIGRFNVYNALAALAAGIVAGKELSFLIQRLASFPQVPGRLQRVSNPMHRAIYVDFAHTEDALLSVLKTLSEIKEGRIITLFGCGGDRDRKKRPLMAHVVEAYSDLAIITSDNPRSEDPEKICQEIASGFTQKEYILEVDRKCAIEKALGLQRDRDILLIAGKGHEKTQEIQGQKHPFDDVAVVEFLSQNYQKIEYK